MRCPHCGNSNTWLSCRFENQPHGEDCYNDHYSKCVREKWRCDKGHEWTQWTCEG